MKKTAKFVSSALLTLLALSACAEEPLATLALTDGASCRLYGSTLGVRRFEVVAPDGSVTATLKPPAPDIEPDPLGGAEVVDLDFDGDLDLRLRSYQYTNGDLRYACYRWQDGTLVWDETLSALRALSLDAEAQTLTAWTRGVLADEYELTTRITYAWVDGTLTEVARRSLYHYIAEGEEMYRVVDTVDGVEEERWVFPRQFKENEIWE